MPEGPEVRRNADRLQESFAGQPIVLVQARTKLARSWLSEHPDALCGRTVDRVVSKGKNLVGYIEGGFYFYAHLMMWGRWQFFDGSLPVERDRRERARIASPDTGAILFSAPVFEIGEGDPFESNPYLRRLGPDSLPYQGHDAFDTAAFLHRLLASENSARAIGAVLLDQQIAAGIGNYLRAEILFACKLDPWKLVGELAAAELECLSVQIPGMAARAYRSNGRTVTDAEQARIQDDANLRYPGSGERGSYHYVFRRTNLPCVLCGDTVRQKPQVTREDEDGEKERIIYFCPTCQQPSVAPTWINKPRKKSALPDSSA